MSIDPRTWSTVSALFLGFLGGALFMVAAGPTVHVTPAPSGLPAPMAEPPPFTPVVHAPAATLSLSRTRVAPGQQVVVAVTTAAALPRDAWVGIIPSHVPHGDEAVNDRHDLSYQYLEGRREGVFVFSAPDTPGAYDLRLHSTDASGIELASVSFHVAGY